MQLEIRWGVLSPAQIGIGQVIPAMLTGKRCEVAAIAFGAEQQVGTPLMPPVSMSLFTTGQNL